MHEEVALLSPENMAHSLKLYFATLLGWMPSPPCSLKRRCFWLADMLRWTFRWAGDCIELLLRSLLGRDLWLRLLLDRDSLPSNYKDKWQFRKQSHLHLYFWDKSYFQCHKTQYNICYHRDADWALSVVTLAPFPFSLFLFYTEKQTQSLPLAAGMQLAERKKTLSSLWTEEF